MAGSNSEAIQHITLKLTMTECPKRHYVRTKIRGVSFFFCVDLTWNNSIGEQILNGNVLLSSTKMETIDWLI